MLAMRRSSTPTGNNGVLPVLGEQSIVSTAAPSRTAASSAARANRDLPIPASPMRHMACPWPPSEEVHASDKRTRASARPMIAPLDPSKRCASKRETTCDLPMTRHARAPSSNPFSWTLPRSSYRKKPAAKRLVASEMTTWPGSATPLNLSARSIVSPAMDLPPAMAIKPEAIPTRNCSRILGTISAAPIASTTSRPIRTADLAASSRGCGKPNTTKAPSPSKASM